MAIQNSREIPDNDALIDPSEYLADIPMRLVSGLLGLMGFSTSIVIGMIAGNPASVILIRAMIAMFFCAIVGRLLGAIGEVCVREFVVKYKSDRPQPKKPEQLLELDREKRAHEKVVKNMKKAA